MKIWDVTKQSFVQIYENLFKFLLINLAWFLLNFGLVFIGYSALLSGWWLPAVLPVIFLGPLFLSGLHTSLEISTSRYNKIKSYFIGIKDHFKRGLLGCLYSLLVYGILFVDLYFFLKNSKDSLIMTILAVILFYIVILFSMSQLYFWGLLTLQPGEKIKVIIKRSILLVLDNVVFSFIWLLVILILTAILIFTGIGMAVLLLGLLSLYILNGTQLMLQQYQESKEGETD